MRSQNSVLAYSTTTLGSLTLTSNKEHSRSTTPVAPHHSSYKQHSLQMTTGGGINNGNNSTSAATVQKNSSTLPLCNTIPKTSSINTLSKSSTISSTTRHSNVSLSSNNSNSTIAINNNKLSSNNYNNNFNNNEKNNNSNSTKLQTLEQRKLELEKLLNEKNWLLQQIVKQEAQVLNGNYENFNLLESKKGNGNIVSTVGTTTTTTTTSSVTSNSILRRKGSSSLKLPKSNVQFNGKSNHFTLSKSEYDITQESKLSTRQTTANTSVLGNKKRQVPPQKTNSFHDSTSASVLSLTKSPSFEYNESTSYIGGSSVIGNNKHVTHCDKYYLSPTSQMYADGNGFIKASQNIKQCLSPSPMNKITGLNDAEVLRGQQMHMINNQNLLHKSESHPRLEQFESVDTLSLSPSNHFEQNHHMVNQHSNLWQALANSDRSAWCGNSYTELDSNCINQYHNINPQAKQKVLPTSISGLSMQHSPESPALGNFYPVGGIVLGNFPNTKEKSCDEVSISSVNSDNKKPKNKQWKESSLDGPMIRPNILQTTPLVIDAVAFCPALSPTISQNQQYAYYNVARQATALNATVKSGNLTPSSAIPVGGSSLLIVPVISSKPPTRLLAHHSHPLHKQSYRERAKLSSQSMSSGSYRTPKTKLDDENNHLSHSTSYLNVDPYNHHHHFPQQQPVQNYQHNHYHLEIPNSTGNVMLPPLQQLQLQQQKQIHQQKSLKTLPSTPPQPQTQLSKFSPTIQTQECSPSVNDDFVGTIRYATSVATQPSRLCNSSQTLTKNTMQQKQIPPNSLSINPVQQTSSQTSGVAATSPDIRIESPKNMTVVQQATFLPYKEVTKPFEMSDFYKYSTKFRQKEANTATMPKNST